MTRQQRINAVILFAFWLFYAAVVVLHSQIAPHSFPFINIDEQAHYSYTMDLIRNHSWWPDFEHFPMIDAATGEPTKEPNYINHPPQFYWLMKLVQQAFPHADPIRYRMVPLAFYLLAFGIYARVGYLLELPRPATLMYVLMPILFYVPLQTGYYNNDSMAICGGMLACLGSFCWFKGIHPQRAFAFLMLGLVLASVKLTAFLLVGAYVACVLIERRASVKQYGCALVLAAILALPFLYFWLHYGSPAPNTPGQDYLMVHNAAKWGWVPQPQASFLHFLLIALPQFADQFSIPEWTFLPLLWLVFSALVFTVRRRSLPAPLAPLARCALLATLPVLTIHMVFAYGRYQHYGWLLDMFVRYYFPLLPAYGALAASGYLLLDRRS